MGVKRIFTALKNKAVSAAAARNKAVSLIIAARNTAARVKDKICGYALRIVMPAKASTAVFNAECGRNKTFGRLFNGFSVGAATLVFVSSPAFAAMDLGEGAEFFNSAIDCLKVLVIALGIGLGGWGVVNLLEGYGNDNPGAKSQGMKQLMVFIRTDMPFFMGG